ncbi:ATPase, T2SS/T4P/T4SS family [Cupriavidus sp. TMH.W2]|uniref:ATPase, T2SS/T4P/T4SS family n=1 Tax=Cupriavidus sp. TMH.W2 TaxID=3434465 RepID=UPI003D787A3C
MFARFLKPKPQPQAKRTAPPARRTLAQGTATQAPQTPTNVVPLQSARAAAPGTRSGGGAAAPAGPRLVAQAADLPQHMGVISGQDKHYIVRLTEAQERTFCVIRTSQREASIVASPAFGALPEAERVSAIQQVRDALAERNMQHGRVVRATAEVVAGLVNDRRAERTQGDTEELEAAKNSEGGRFFESWTNYAVIEGATDIHIEIRDAARVVFQRFRIETELEDMRNPLPCFPAQAKDAISVAYNKLTATGTGSHSNFMENEYQYAMIPFEHGGTGYKLRVQTLPTSDGIDIVMRVLKMDSKAYFPLAGDNGQGFEASQEAMMLRAMGVETGGVIVISGITGSGKTTAAKAMLDFQPDKERKKRIGIEDPKEYDIDNYTGLSIQRDVGDPAASLRAYMKAYASLMRADLDLGYVGEIRDNVSANAAVVIAESGHLAMGSNHARELMGILPRMTSQAIGADLYALTEPGMFRLMVNQSLVATLCKKCRIELHKAPLAVRDEMKRVSDDFEVDTSSVFLRHPDGCPHCRGRGIKGMTVVAEVYEPSNEFLALMRERKTAKAKELWLSTWDGKFDSDNMIGKTQFEHAFLKMLRGDIDPSLARARLGGLHFSDHLKGDRSGLWQR